MANLSVTSIARQAESPPPITEAGLKPGRYADHALMGRIHAILSWLLLGLCAVLAAIGISREGVPSCVVSRLLHDLIRPGDWVRILSSGVLLPLLWFLFITRLTPLAAREWGMKPSGFLLPVIQLSSLTLLMLTACAVSASRVLGKRAGFLGLKPRLPKSGVIAVMAAALAIPVTGAAPWIPPLANLIFTAGCGLAGAAVLWLLWGFSAHVLRRPRDASLRRAMLARMVIPAWFCGMLVMAVMAPLHYAGERHWIQQDRLMEISADAPAMSRHEWDVTLQLRKELLEMIR